MDSRDSSSQNPIFNDSCSPINLEDDNVVEVGSSQNSRKKTNIRCVANVYSK